MEKLEICQKTRSIAAQTLGIVLKKVLKEKKMTSEVDFRNLWLEELQKFDQIFTEGWYIPPPDGIGVLFSTDENPTRTNISSLRPPAFWPQDNIFLNFSNDLIFVYASPVNKKTGIIGDFGMTIYLGTNPKLKSHLKNSLTLTKNIFDFTEEGRQFCEVYNHAQQLLTTHHLVSGIASPTDPTGTNIGHTIPFSDENWKSDERKIFENGKKKWQAVSNLISHKRKFVNSVEEFVIQPNLAFTIEPRPTGIGDPSLPMVWFHTIAMFDEKHRKTQLTHFEEIFQISGMTYMLSG